jgi:hypothetical protein
MCRTHMRTRGTPLATAQQKRSRNHVTSVGRGHIVSLSLVLPLLLLLFLVLPLFHFMGPFPILRLYGVMDAPELLDASAPKWALIGWRRETLLSGSERFRAAVADAPAMRHNPPSFLPLPSSPPGRRDHRARPLRLFSPLPPTTSPVPRMPQRARTQRDPCTASTGGRGGGRTNANNTECYKCGTEGPMACACPDAWYVRYLSFPSCLNRC